MADASFPHSPPQLYRLPRCAILLITETLRYISPLFIAILVATLSLVFAACAGRYDRSAPGIAQSLMPRFARGDAELDCSLSCSGRWGWNRREMKHLHDTAQWHELAERVLAIGFNSDLSWYYLGRAAEGLGHVEAARTYYNKGQASQLSGQCAPIINVCDGFVFPQTFYARLRNLDKPPSGETPALTRSSPVLPAMQLQSETGSTSAPPTTLTKQNTVGCSDKRNLQMVMLKLSELKGDDVAIKAFLRDVVASGRCKRIPEGTEVSVRTREVVPLLNIQAVFIRPKGEYEGYWVLPSAMGVDEARDLDPLMPR